MVGLLLLFCCPPCLPRARVAGGTSSPSSPLTVELLSASWMKCCCCCAERTAWGSCGGRRVPRAASQDSFERTKYFGPVSGLGVASAVLDKARAEEASRAMSVACADGVPKRTGRLGRLLAVVSSAGTGACIREVQAACTAATHLWQYLCCSSHIFCTCSSLHAADFCFHSDGINMRGWAKVHINGKHIVEG